MGWFSVPPVLGKRIAAIDLAYRIWYMTNSPSIYCRICIVCCDCLHICWSVYLLSSSNKIIIFSAGASGGYRNLSRSRRTSLALPQPAKGCSKCRLCQAPLVICRDTYLLLNVTVNRWHRYRNLFYWRQQISIAISTYTRARYIYILYGFTGVIGQIMKKYILIQFKLKYIWYTVELVLLEPLELKFMDNSKIFVSPMNFLSCRCNLFRDWN